MYRLYRLKKARPLGNLFGIGSGGCADFHSGIGNVSYVKDILTETVVTTKFSCSKFGPNNHLGWVTIIVIGSTHGQFLFNTVYKAIEKRNVNMNI